MRHRLLAAVFVATALVLSGCAAAGESNDAAAPTIVDPQLVPGSMLDASAITARAPEDVRLAVIAPTGSGEQEQAALDAVEIYAAAHGGSVTVHADVDGALTGGADVIVGIGPGAVGGIDLASAANLDASFLVLGTQLAEPTGNVIAVVWPGADQRAVFAAEEHPFAGAAAYSARAIETGLAAFASDLEGHVIALD